jgi:hypothetical protein
VKVSLSLLGLTVLQLRKKRKLGSTLAYDLVVLDWDDEHLLAAANTLIEWHNTRQRLNEQTDRLERLIRGEH